MGVKKCDGRSLAKRENEQTNFSSRNSISEPDLTTAGRKSSKSGFPPGTTVDELCLYRRKRAAINSWPHDNLELLEGSFKSLKTEYERRYKNYYDFGSWGHLQTPEDLKSLSPVRADKPDDHLKLEGSLELHPEYNEKFIEYPIERRLRIKPVSSSLEIIDSNEKKPEKMPSQVIPIRHQQTNLQLEGDLSTTTEQAEQFIEYLISRPDLQRRRTTLKLEGDMEIKTENREKFVPYEHQSRPPLCKKFTNLHLEGDLIITTEQQEQFVPYEYQKRPPLTKKSTNLHMEGSLDFSPEYRREFIEYKAERPKLALPINNLKTNGFYSGPLEDLNAFQQQIHPQIPFLRNSDNQGNEIRRRESAFRVNESESKTQFVKKSVGHIERTRGTNNNLTMEGRIDMNPEYKNAYIDFNKNHPMDSKPQSRHRNLPQGNLKSEGVMDIHPEYQSSYVDFPRQRPSLRKPECSLSSEGEISHMTEKNEKYVSYPMGTRVESLKREPQLKLEGQFECQPEYRKAYIDYLIRERVQRKTRPMDHLGAQIERALEEKPVVKTAVANVQITIDNDKDSSSVQSENALKPPSPVKSRPPSRSETERKISARNRSLSQIESSAFGPRLIVPPAKKKSSSRSSSPNTSSPSRRRSRTLPRNRHLSTESDGGTTSPRDRRFGNPVRVANLACRSTPHLPLVDVSARNKWMRDSSVESSSAFVVLDKKTNSNYYPDEKRSKWAPVWSDSSS